MDNEIESLWLSLGIKPDDPSASDAVDKIIKTVQSKLKSSIYGGKDGVITLPATIEGKFKNGREIDKSITDAYAAIYEKAKQMADESVSLTLKDVEDFKAQIDKFGKKTSKYKSSDIISNANNNLRQMLSTYQDYVNELRIEVSKVQKTQTKQAQKTKAQQKAKTKKSNYHGITDEEINDAIAKENARQAKLKASRDKQAADVASKLDVRSGSIDAGRTNKKEAMASEFSEYSSNWARALAKALKDNYSTKLTNHFYDKEFKSDAPKGRMSRKTTKEEYLNALSTQAIKELGGLIGKVEHGDESVTFDKIVEAIGVIRTIFEENGKSMETIARAITTTVQGRYDQPQDVQPDEHGDRKRTYKKDRYGNRIGGIDVEEGEQRGVGKGHAQAQEYQRGIQRLLEKMLGTVGDIAKHEEQANKVATEIVKETKTKKTKNSAYEAEKKKAVTSEASADTRALAQEIKGEKSRDERSYIQDVRESSREAVADTAEGQKNQAMLDIEQQDVGTGFNTDAKADDLIRTVEKSKENDKNKDKVPKQVKDVLGQVATTLANLNLSGKSATPISTSLESAMCPCQDILTQIAESAKNIDVNLGNVIQQLLSLGAKLPNNLPALIEGETVKDKPVDKEPVVDKTNIAKIVSEHQSRQVDHDRAEAIVKNVTSKIKEDRQEKQKMYEALFRTAEVNRPGPSKLQNSRTQISPFQYNDSKIYNAIKKAFGIDSTRKNARDISKMTQSEQEKLRAERISKFGLSRGGRDTDTGDIAQTYRTRRNFGWGKNIENPFQNLKITDGIDIDTTAITEALQNAIQKNMFNAQTGGWLKNIIGPATLYAGQPSLEKSRAEIDAANSIMAEIRATVQNILNDILSKETDLKGLVDSGQAVFENGKLVQDTSKNGAATKLFADLEEQKQALRGVLADAGMVEETVERTGGNVTRILQQLGFVAPELRKCNTIVQNLNSGLDKNGKALKFQTRTAEVLNYSFQLMARNIGQMIKNWIALLNPINLIKRAFSDFASYDVKWQRTMNVIKYNLRRIIRPFMEWLAQQLVNVIGLVNALMKGIGKVFGKNWDLFDKSAASAEQMREELEQAANVTASFDELHDIGTQSSSNPAMDLMGDIYTPQWEGLYEMLEKVGEIIGKIIKAVSGWTFWDWLKLIGAALVGYLALKWLLSLFGKGKNPLQSVADGLNFLCKAVGWALLIWAFTEFTKALTDFVECMKTADWDDIAKALIMLGGAFALLFAGITGVQGMTKWLGVTTGELFGMSALVGVFALFVKAIVPFIECIKDLGDEKIEVISASLMTLAAAFVALIGGVAGVEGITKFIGIMGSELLGLSAVIGALDLFVLAIVPFIKAISEIEGNKWDTIIPMITGLVGAFIALAAGVGVVSRAFSTMDWKAIGQLYAVAGVFEVFMLALVPFLHAIKGLDFETLSGGTMLIAGAFLALGGALALMTPFLKMLDWSSLLEFVVIMGVMAGLIWVLQAFVNALKDVSTEQIYAGLILLAGGLMAITVAVGALLVILSAAIASGVGALAILALAGVLAVVALVIVALADLVRALGEAGAGIKQICEGIEGVIRAIGEVIMGIITAVAEGIATVVTAIAEGITTILTPILEFIDGVIGKITELATTIAREIGETIRTVVQTTGEVIIKIIDSLVSAIPKLLDAILRFVREIGPAVETSCDAIMRTITKLINFVISGIEYLVNTLVIDSINKAIATVTLGAFSNVFSHIEIARFVPKYEQGTDYVPNDGLAYLHQGEAVVPKKYNTPYQPDNSGMSNAIDRLAQQVSRISEKVEQGIPVKGQFIQRGSDLVATVEKANNRMKNNVLNNKVYAR